MNEQNKPANIVSVADVVDEISQRLEKWKKEKRIGRVSFDAEFKALNFHFDETSEQVRYHVPASEFETPESQIKWLNHLRRKNWFTRETFNDLMDALEILGLIRQGL